MLGVQDSCRRNDRERIGRPVVRRAASFDVVRLPPDCIPVTIGAGVDTLESSRGSEELCPTAACLAQEGSEDAGRHARIAAEVPRRHGLVPTGVVDLEAEEVADRRGGGELFRLTVAMVAMFCEDTRFRIRSSNTSRGSSAVGDGPETHGFVMGMPTILSADSLEELTGGPEAEALVHRDRGAP